MAFERCIADLESGTRGFAFSSGLAASSTVLELLDAGSHIVAVDDMYGGSWRLFERVRKRSMGLRVSYADPSVAGSLEKALQPDTKMIWAETPSNPLLKITDLAAIAKIGKAARHPHRGGQHLRFALAAAAAGTRHRSGRALGHQVHQRPLGHGGRPGGRRRAQRDRREARVHAERDRLDPRSVLQLPRPARREDAAAAHASALRQRDASGDLAQVSPQDRAGHLSGPAEPSATPARGEADERLLRRDDRGLSEDRHGRRAPRTGSMSRYSRWRRAWAASKAWSAIP